MDSSKMQDPNLVTDRTREEILALKEEIVVRIYIYINEIFIYGQEPQHERPRSHVRQNREPVVEDVEKLKLLRADKLSTRIILIIIVTIGQVYDLLNTHSTFIYIML